MSRSANFSDLIMTEGAKLNALHAEIHRTFEHRSRGTAARREWEEACEAFRSFESPLAPYVVRACEEAQYTDKNVLEFVVCFLEVNPKFFRSGYLKEAFLTRLKRSVLDAGFKRRLRAVLLDAVAQRGSREFKHYCRLASVIADQGVVSTLEGALAREDEKVRGRARLMLNAIRQRRGRSAVGA